jgi:hypothetical protein
VKATARGGFRPDGAGPADVTTSALLVCPFALGPDGGVEPVGDRPQRAKLARLTDASVGEVSELALSVRRLFGAQEF